jgi:hypothetical protein
MKIIGCKNQKYTFLFPSLAERVKIKMFINMRMMNILNEVNNNG